MSVKSEENVRCLVLGACEAHLRSPWPLPAIWRRTFLNISTPLFCTCERALHTCRARCDSQCPLLPYIPYERVRQKVNIFVGFTCRDFASTCLEKRAWERETGKLVMLSYGEMGVK
jgi:hypothetical protein